MRGKRKKEKKELEEGLFEEPSESRRITPVDIQQKEFRLAMRGYHERDVDQFLDEVTEEVARLHAENKRLREEFDAKASSGSGPAAASEADAVLRRAREDAARIVREAESRARTISAAGTGSNLAGSPIAGPALAGFLSREKDFLQNLAKLMQDHANAMKDDVRRVRESAAAGGRSVSPPAQGAPSRPAPAGRGWREMAGATPVGAPEQAYRAPGQPETAQREEPEESQEAWRPPPPQASVQAPVQDAIPPAAVQGAAAAIPGVFVASPEPPGSEQPPYFMDEPSQRPASATPSIEASSSTALAGEDARPETGSMAEPIIDVRGDAIEPATTSASWQPAPAASGDPYVDEPTREWTLGEGGLAAEDIAHATTARPSTPDATFARWAPEAEDDGTSERSLKELFWGED